MVRLSSAAFLIPTGSRCCLPNQYQSALVRTYKIVENQTVPLDSSNLFVHSPFLAQPIPILFRSTLSPIYYSQLLRCPGLPKPHISVIGAGYDKSRILGICCCEHSAMYEEFSLENLGERE